MLAVLIFSCSEQQQQQAENKTGSAKDSVKSKTISPFDNCEKLFADALRYDSTLQTHNETNKEIANKAIRAFLDFAYYCQQDSLAPVYLIKTAQVARAIDNLPQAKSALDQCIANYREFKDRPAAMFLLAQLYDDNTSMNNEAEAGIIYRQIIDEYPKSVWALNAEAAMVYLGKSDAELLKEFNKKAKKK